MFEEFTNFQETDPNSCKNTYVGVVYASHCTHWSQFTMSMSLTRLVILNLRKAAIVPQIIIGELRICRHRIEIRICRDTHSRVILRECSFKSRDFGTAQGRV